MAQATQDITATGRRKTSVARVRLRRGSGTIRVNGRDLDAYFPAIKDRVLVTGVLEQVDRVGVVDIDITVDGGGSAGQAGACRLGISRALKVFDADLYLWEQGYFFEHCLGNFFKTPAGELAALASLPVLRHAAERLASLPCVLVHRDFQSQNVMIREGAAWWRARLEQGRIRRGGEAAAAPP